MIDPVTGMHQDFTFGPEERKRAEATCRLEVEAELIARRSAVFEPTFFRQDARFFSEVSFTVNSIVHPVQGYTSVDFLLRVPQNYPYEAPRIYPVRPVLPFSHHAHLNVDELDDNRTHICVWAEGEWTLDHSLAGAMWWAAVWVNKYAVYRHDAKWPGPERPHCSRCGVLVEHGCSHHPRSGE